MVCGNFILPEPASYVFFYAIFNLRKLLYIIGLHGKRLRDKNRVRPAAADRTTLPGAAAGAANNVSKSGSIQMERAA